ncbi:MAG: hypothetical protein ACXU71_01905 [Croceibacterium sp.]
MAEPGEVRVERRRKRRKNDKRRNTKLSNLLYKLRAVAIGLAVGLPILAYLLYLVSR